MTLRRVVAAPARAVARRSVRVRTRSWPKHSRLFAVGERSGWSVDEDARHLEATALRLDYHVAPSSWARHAEDQAVFLTSHFEALHPRWLESSHRLGTAYLHGRPGTPGYPEFDVAFETLRRNAHRFARIQVTHDEMYELVVSAGVDPGRVFRIPIGIDLDHFAPVDAQLREAARNTLDLPADAFVVGSFQKDGIGWGSGLEPKLIKGPDLLVAVLAQVRAAASGLVALLPAPLAVTSGTSSTVSGSRISTILRTAASSLRVRTTHSTCVSLPHDKREGPRPCSRRWPPAFPS